MTPKSWFISLFIFFVMVSFAAAEIYLVERAVDGDTLKLANGERVRLIGIDTPEASVNQKTIMDSARTGRDVETIKKLGQEAKAFVDQLVRGKYVDIEFDVRREDQYGRLLGYVYLPVAGGPELKIVEGIIAPGFDGKLEVLDDFKSNHVVKLHLNAYIVQQGYASLLTIAPNLKHEDTFSRLYDQARMEQKGLWSKDSQILKTAEKVRKKRK